MKLIKIYDLKEDKSSIESLQKASLNPDPEFGFKISPYGLIGSPQWWQAVQGEVIPVHIVQGKIVNVYNTGHGNNFPEFDVNCNGNVSSWMLEGNKQYYKIGNEIRIMYVLQEYKIFHKGLGSESQVVLTIEAQEVDIIKELFDGLEMV